MVTFSIAYADQNEKDHAALKRAIQEHLLDPLATKLLAGEFKPGDKIKVSAKDEELIFQRK